MKYVCRHAKLISYRSVPTNLSFSAPIAILRRYLNGTEPIDGDAKDGVNGT